MLNKLQKSRANSSNKGFTIIEVMIVLAIAGLILLIVFLAVPALQRSSRNTQRKTDIGRIGSAATTVVSNNNGQIAALTSANLQNEVGANLSYYTNTNISVAVGVVPVTNATTVDTVRVYTGAICGTMTGGLGATTTGATSRSMAVVYSTETGGATPARGCTDQ